MEPNVTALAPPPASKSSQALLRRLAQLSLKDIARALGRDESVASRARSGEREATLAELCALIDLCELKLVDKSRVCVDRQAYESMTYIASKAMSDPAMSRQLIWEDE